MRSKSRFERNRLELFSALPGDLAPRAAQDLKAYPFFSLAKSKRVVPLDFRARDPVMAANRFGRTDLPFVDPLL